MTIFHLYSEAPNTQWFVKRFEEKLKEARGDDAPSTFLGRLTAGENVSREVVKPCGCSNAALIQVFQVFNHRF
jgi:hypothetical protein